MQTDRDAPPRLLSARAFLEATVAAALAFVLCLPVFGRFWDWLDSSWGASDTLPGYVQGQLWSFPRFETSTQYGYPLGLDFNYYPTLDPLPNTMIQILGILNSDPFFGTNLLTVLAFPLLAFGALFLFRIVGMTGPLAVAGAVSFSLIPYHFFWASGHFYLALQFGVIGGLALSLLVATGRFETLMRSFRGSTSVKSKIVAVSALGVLVILAAGNGTYYAFCTVLLGLAALAWRFSRGTSWRVLMVDAMPFIAVGFLGLLALALIVVPIDTPPLYEPAQRKPVESILYAGTFALLLLPAPTFLIPFLAPYQVEVESLLVGPEGRDYGSLGTLVTTVSLLVLVVGLLLLRRNSIGSQFRQPLRDSRKLDDLRSYRRASQLSR